MAEAGKDSSDFTILALTQHYLQFCRTAACLQQFRAFYLNETLGDVDALAHLSHGFCFDFTRHGDSIDLSDTELWVGESLCEFPIVGEQDQSFTASVESTNGKNTFIWRDQVNDPWAAVWITISCDDANRFVDGEVDRFLFLEQYTVDAYFLNGAIDCRTKFGDNLSIDINTTCFDQLLALSAASKACGGEKTLQTLGRIRRLRRTPASLFRC